MRDWRRAFGRFGRGSVSGAPPVENSAREWRASFRNWRARVTVTDSEYDPESARHRKPMARQSRATFSTGGSQHELLAKSVIRARYGECAPETPVALLLLLDV